MNYSPLTKVHLFFLLLAPISPKCVLKYWVQQIYLLWFPFQVVDTNTNVDIALCASSRVPPGCLPKMWQVQESNSILKQAANRVLNMLLPGNLKTISGFRFIPWSAREKWVEYRIFYFYDKTPPNVYNCVFQIVRTQVLQGPKNFAARQELLSLEKIKQNVLDTK